MKSEISPRSPLLLCVLVAAWLPLGAEPAAAQCSRADGVSTTCVLTDAGMTEPGCPRFLAPVHATLLPDGQILLAGVRRTAEEECTGGSPCGDWACGGWEALLTPDLTTTNPPSSLALQVESPPLEYDAGPTFCPLPEPTCSNIKVADTLFCGGHTQLADGSVFFAGGTRIITDPTNGVSRAGLPYGTTFDAVGGWGPRVPFVGTGGWTCPHACGGTDYITGEERWYPTATKRADGTVLVTGVTQVIWYEGAKVLFDPPLACGSGRNLSLERFDPFLPTPATTLVSLHTTTPEDIWAEEYAHVFQLPKAITRTGKAYDVLLFGDVAEPILLDDSGTLPVGAGAWLDTNLPRPPSTSIPNPNHGASSVMLPFLVPQPATYKRGSVLVAGGEVGSPQHSRVSIYDPNLSGSGAWIGDVPLLTGGRHHPSTVVLPTGEILVVSGHDAGYVNGRQAEYVDPRNGFAQSCGTALLSTIRGYHTATLLLPDGRVFLGGGRGKKSGGCLSFEKASFEYYFPPYWSASTPLEILNASATVGYGGDIDVSWKTTRASPQIEFALVALGSMTHSFDMNQRYIELDIELLGGIPGGVNYIAQLSAPANSRVAPPGYYMLFAIDRSAAPEPDVCKEAWILLLQ